ncbi:MAG: holdfast anchoring protein HfaA [Rhizomicrobium sp.]|jgi:holdfast attachment protein HfaA
MPQKTRQPIFAGIAAAGIALVLASPAAAQMANASSYNNPYGMTQGSENQAVDPSLRDANGNLALVNGQFQSSSMSQQSGVQNMGVLGGGASGSSLGSGVGFGPVTSATAIGNSLNVVTVGSNNTVIVNSTQTNNGNQTATTSGH